jgi:hypothetical protein
MSHNDTVSILGKHTKADGNNGTVHNTHDLIYTTLSRDVHPVMKHNDLRRVHKPSGDVVSMYA